MDKKRSIRALVVNYEYPPLGGGGGVVSRDVAEGLVELGHAATVVTSRYADLPPYEIVNGVAVHRVRVLMRNKQDTASHASMLSFVPSALFLALRLRRDGIFDVVNTHFAIPSGPVGHLMARMFRVPHVLSIHGGDIFDPSKSLSPHRTPGLWQAVRYLLRAADAVIACSSDTLRNTRRYYRVDRPIARIPLAVPLGSLPARDRGTLSLRPEDFVLCTIGRLVRRKDVGALLEIAASLASALPCHLVVIGDGPEQNALQKRARELGIQDRVTFTGRASEGLKRAYLAASDAFVSTAMHEGFGIVFLEAMRHGLPVVCYDHGGQTDFLRSGGTGFVLKLGDTRAFEEAIRRLYGDTSLRARIRRQNRRYVKSFSVTACAGKYVDAFERAMAAKKFRARSPRAAE